MPYVIAEPCIKDGSCVEVCPVACIHTTPDAEQFYIDPDVCIECEQCKIVCPVQAVHLDVELPDEWVDYIEVNARFFRQNKAAIEPVHLDDAERMAAAAQAYASEKGVAITVAVVDGSGAPILVSQMDGAEPWTTELALSKAYTATSFTLGTDQLGPDGRQPFFRSLVISNRGRVLAALPRAGLPAPMRPSHPVRQL